MKISIVVDPVFGDGGKGMVTNYLANLAYPERPIIIRYTGGHQAGHNVVTSLGSHIHSSYPSGTLVGHPGYISEHCLVYPPAMRAERAVLASKGVSDVLLYVHPLALVTTPCDVLGGQLRERANLHGSVGVGIGQTMIRHYINQRHRLHVSDLFNKFTTMNKLSAMYTEFKHQYGIQISDEDQINYLNDIEWLLDNITVASYDVLYKYNHWIFEGSQGVLLDKDHGMYPNVTFGNTTCKNAIDVIDKLDFSIHMRTTYYVTRCYQTRHGNGPMTDERVLPLINAEQETNTTNQWQGAFRVGLFDPNLVEHGIYIDNVYNNNSPVRPRKLVLTCTDQLEHYPYLGNQDNVELSGLINSISVNFSQIYISDNPYSEIKLWT